MNNRIGEEHPLCDIGQIFFLSIFIIVWILDSFLLHWSVFFFGQINLLIRSLLALCCIVTGIYFEKGSKEVLIKRSDSESRVIDFGVFSIVRHPTYLGVLLLLLGLFFWSFSLISLVIWVCFFFFYDRMATYEENDLIEKYNNEYKIYKKSVRKWIPSKRKRSACVDWSKKNGLWIL